jgi:transposase
VIGEDYHVIVPPQEVLNTVNAITEWLKEIQTNQTLLQASDPGKPFSLSATCESTSYYHHAVVKACSKLGISAEPGANTTGGTNNVKPSASSTYGNINITPIPCRVMNPIVTKQAVKATIRGKKTDAIDAVLIAKLGLRGEGTLTTAETISGSLNDAKVLLRISHTLLTAKQSITAVTKTLKERSVSAPEGGDEQLDECLKQLQVLIDNYRSTAAELLTQEAEYDEVIELLMSIPGVGKLTAVTVLAEIGDINRFDSIDKLVAYVGLDPRVRQSGTSLHRNTSITKRGSPHLRHTIFSSANVLRQHDQEVKDYYTKKRNQGRTYTEAMMPICRKLLARIYAVWKNRRKYEKR